jgi:3-phytase
MTVSMVAALTLTAVAALPVAGTSGHSEREVRFATFNASLNRGAQGQLVADLSNPGNIQAGNVAEVIQLVRPDVLLINEFDFDANGVAVDLFQENYLGVSQNTAEPIEYPYRLAIPSNTGILSGFDLNNNGITAGPADIGMGIYGDDSWGFGLFPGQFAFAVFSKYPIVDRLLMPSYRRRPA